MYDCEKSPLTHELSYIGLFNFFHLNLFHVNIICINSFKISLSLYFFLVPQSRMDLVAKGAREGGNGILNKYDFF